MLLCAAVLGGCSRNQPPKGPRETLHDVLRAVETGNRLGFMDNVYGGQADKAAMGALFDMMHGFSRLAQEMLATYGKDRLPELLRQAPLMTTDQLSGATEKIDGERATVRVGESVMSLVRNNGRWLVDFSVDAPPDAATAARLRAMNGAISNARSKIGKEGYDPMRIARELSADLSNPPAPTQPAGEDV
jgi:hypothetical protein